MRCPNCQTENPSQAKFCLECGNRLLLCPNCGTVNLSIAKFCIECGTPLQARTPASAETGPMPTITNSALTPTYPGPPSTQAAPSELLLPPEERRVVTIMFADITSYTPLADRLDPEDMRAILTGYFNLMTAQIRKHGGIVEKYIGDAVMAVFGSPIAHEDDPDRAIRAALDMQEALTHFNEQRLQQSQTAMRLQMRIGINTGEVAIPNNVQHARQDFLITGDAVNVAARLQQVATPETILVGERTYLATREVFDFRALAPLRVKGKPEPISAYVVLGIHTPTTIVAQHPRGIKGRRAPLVGRTLELTLLHASYARVLAERHPHLITILGQPGIGKSRLVREFIEREKEKQKSTSTSSQPANPLILKGRCPPYGEGITYWPLIEILRSLLEAQEDEPIEALQKRFILFVSTTLKQAGRSESAEEIAETLLRSIGRDLSGKLLSAEKSWPGRDYKGSTHTTATIKVNGGTQVALLRAWRVLLEALGEQHPLIIVVDDLQWADEALLDLLGYLTDRATSEPILFLCPTRPDFFDRRRDWGGGQRNFTTIELEALSREEGSELVDALLNFSELPEVLRYTILTRAEGNPFFVEELVRMFIDQGILVQEEDARQQTPRWRLNTNHETFLLDMANAEERVDDTLIGMHYLLPLQYVPDTIQGVLAARVDLLYPVEKAVLQHASIIGRTFSLAVLLEITGGLTRESILDALSNLISRDFIVESNSKAHSPDNGEGSFSFKHILIRDVVYNNIPRMRRSQEHTHIALWYENHSRAEKEAYVELLAYHYQQALLNWSIDFSLALPADDQQDATGVPTGLTQKELRERAIRYLTMAGDQAIQSYYTLRALQAYNDAFDLLIENEPDPLEIIQMHIRLGEAYFQRSDADEAWQAYRRALRLATSEEHPVEGANVLDLYERLAELATRWQGTFSNPPDLAETRTYIDAALRLIDGQPLSRSKVALLTYQTFWYTRNLEIVSHARKAELAEQALASGHKSLRLAEELNDPRVLSLALDALSFIYAEYHRYNEVHTLQHRRQVLENQLTDRGELYDLYFSLGSSHEVVDDYPNALMWFGRAYSNAQTMESPHLLLTCMVGRMRAWRQWNRWDNARQVAHELLNFVEQHQQDEKRQLWALETLSTIAYRRGETSKGDQYARQFKRLIDLQVERSANGRVRQMLNTKMHAIHLAREDWSDALVDYRTKLENSEPLPSPDVLSTLSELLVITGASEEEQRTYCERAVTLAETSGARKNLAIAMRARGRMHMAQKIWNLAVDDLRSALRYCEVLDIPWERGNTLYYLGELYRRRADCEDRETTASQRNADYSRARYYFEQALGFFEALKAQPAVERVRSILNNNNVLV